MERPVDISVIIPVYNGARLLEALVERLIPVLEDFGGFEVLCVDDGSSDGTVEELRRLAGDYPGLRGIRLEKNVGQQEASLCGICRSRGRIVLTMDDDLQHRPEDIGRLVECIEAGTDLVFGVPSSAGERREQEQEKRGQEQEKRGQEQGKRGRKNNCRETAEVSEGRGAAGTVSRGVRALGSSLRDLLFRLISGEAGPIRATSFRALTAELKERICGNREDILYLSASLLRSAHSVDHVEVERSEDGAPPSRYPFRKLAATLIKLLFALPGIPRPIARLFSGRRARVAEQIDGPESEPSRSGRSKKGERPRLLIVGGGTGQLYGIGYARRRGYVVGVSDKDSRAPGGAKADAFFTADTFDAEQTSKAAQEFEAHGLLTYGTDQPVLTVARTSEKLGLPAPISSETALAATNKRVMKRLFSRYKIPSPRYLILREESAEDELAKIEAGSGRKLLKPPFVLKPVDSQGQRGVVRLESAEAVKSYLPSTLSYSREGAAVLEEYYESEEVTFSGVVVGGKLYPLTLTDRVTVSQPPHIGVCVAHNYPSRYTEEYGEHVLVLSRKIVEAFGIEEGPVYFQFLIGEEGVKVNEIACRIGGAYEDEFIPLLTGVDLLGIVMEQALYGRVGEESREQLERCEYPAEGALSVLLFFTEPLVVSSTGDMEEVLRIEGVEGGRYLLEAGRRVGPMENSTGRAGYVIIRGKEEAVVNDRIRRVYSHLAVYSSEGENRLKNYAEESLHVGQKRYDNKRK